MHLLVFTYVYETAVCYKFILKATCSDQRLSSWGSQSHKTYSINNTSVYCMSYDIGGLYVTNFGLNTFFKLIHIAIST
jgi:hypothetical protein